MTEHTLLSPGPFGFRLNLPYLNGVYIAVDAVPDAFLVGDGPFCLVQKAEMQLGHHPASTLVSPHGANRVVVTDIQKDTLVVAAMATDRSADIKRVLTEVANDEAAGVVLLASMDFHEITRVPLERFRRQVAPDCRAPIGLVEGRSLDGDWLDGYARTLDKIAETLPLGTPEPARERVALVGPLYDRGEGDQQGNLAELRRLLAALGLDLVSVWPSGVPTSALAEVRRAGTIVSLPYGRAAARTLAERLFVPLVEAPLPLGLAGTLDFLDTVGAATGRSDAARELGDREAARVEEDTKRHVHRHLVGRRVQLVADPHVALGLSALLPELGMAVTTLVVQGRSVDLPETSRVALEALGAHFEPRTVARPGDGFTLTDEDEAELLIAPTLVPFRPRRAVHVPFGYPNYLSHPLRPRPFLGVEGVRWWVERLVEASLEAETGAPRG